MSTTEFSWAEIESAIAAAMPGHRFGFRRRLRSLRRAAAGASVADPQARLLQEVRVSVELRARRRAGIPRLQYDPSLPIVARREEIAAAIRAHPLVIVCGETGSGKSTQLPKICLEVGRGVDGLIGHTQPRRLAARTIAARLSQELGVALGEQIGYKIRFSDQTAPSTYIKVMTDGILLAETQGQKYLEDYDTLIIDEAHERSLNVDFLLGYLKGLLPRRPDLRVVVTSATLDVERFRHFFATPSGPAPLIEVSGRAYPVEVRYRPPPRDAEGGEADVSGAITQAVAELRQAGPGDVLVFLPTERDIRETAQTLRGWAVASSLRDELEILPLYARLPLPEQERVFAPSRLRKIVLATNVAESSLTVPGIRYVVDTGMARLSRYSARAKVQRLPIEAISRASADQRRGRCGRLGPGICIRLYSEADYQGRDRFTTPEIRRTNLAAVILQIKALRLGAIEDFPFLDPPRPEAIRDGYRTLFELGAIDEGQHLTEIGRALSRWPVDPRLGRMILAAVEEGCLAEVLVIAAALEIQDPRERPVEKRGAADEAHRRHADERSDFISLLRLWDFYHQLRENLSRSQLRKACTQNFLSLTRLREWGEVYRQLRQLVEQAGYRTGVRRDDYAAVHRALLRGLLSGIAYRRDAYEYLGAGHQRWYLWPGSGVFAQRPKWVMAAEIVETSKRYGRTVAEIDPAWIEPLAQHLVNRRYVSPFWSRKRGAALVYEKVSLFGLPIVTGRPVALGTVDPVTARRMFIQHALVEGDSTATFRFLQHNRQVLRGVLQQAAKSRRSEWIVAEAAQFEFYDLRLPKDIYDLRGLRQWLPAAEREDPDRLRMQRSHFVPDAQTVPPTADYPDEFPVETLRLPLEYRFEPGAVSDGVTVVVPRQLAQQLTTAQFEWLVPGRLEEKIAALIRTLPKPVRRHLIPAPDTARDVAAELAFGEGPFLKVLAKVLARRAGVPIAPDVLRLNELPPHLRMNFRIVDEAGQTLGQGRDFDALVRQLAGRGLSQDESGPWQREGLRTWDFEELPETVQTYYGTIPLRRYPTLVDQGESVSLRLVDSAVEARAALRSGLRRLYVLATHGELRTQIAWLPRINEIQLYAFSVCGQDGLERDIACLLAERAFLAEEPLPRTGVEFRRRLAQGAERIPLAVQDVARLLHELFRGYHEARLAWEQNQSARWQYAMDDVREQMAVLAAADFLVETPWNWLQQYPRYFRAIVYRFERLRSGGLTRDERAAAEFRPLWQAYRELAAEHRDLRLADEELVSYRWMLEEYRVSLFAQTLGTAVPVSVPRLQKQWAKVCRPGEPPRQLL